MVADFIRGVALFAPLNDDEYVEVAKAANVRAYSAGETVINEGDQGESLFLVEKGALCVTISDGKGGDTNLGGLEASEFFGERAMLTGASRSASVTAIMQSQVIELPGELMKSMMSRHPAIALELKQVDQLRSRSNMELLEPA